MVDERLGTKNGPGVIDVADFVIELAREWGGLFSFTVTADRGRTGVPRLFIVLKRSPAFAGDNSDYTVRVWTTFPCKGNSTICGAMYRLCYEINEKLERGRLERETQKGF